jgi:hypothetical protein
VPVADETDRSDDSEVDYAADQLVPIKLCSHSLLTCTNQSTSDLGTEDHLLRLQVELGTFLLCSLGLLATLGSLQVRLGDVPLGGIS